ncbi:MAG: adenosine deaminase [Anaerolineae bacterium]|nr:adenosine deaminase [Anaerolineae bacterium]
MTLTAFIQQMPKVELHVHLEGATRPETLLTLARKHGVALPANSVEGIREWYTFTDFDHFIEIYMVICACIRAPEDIELLAREFLMNQARQNILYSEVTYTAYSHYDAAGQRLPYDDQLAALERARAWAERELGVTMRYIIDIPRGIPAEDGFEIARWVAGARDRGVAALGLGGPEVGNPPSLYADTFAFARENGVPCVLHAGETVGPESIWEALEIGHSQRIGHGVRCLEDPALVDHLRARQIPLEVCPSSNVCLKVAPTFAQHPLPRLLAAGLYITLNSDDPPMFNTTLTDEYLRAAKAFSLNAAQVETLVLNGVQAALLPEPERARIAAAFRAEFEVLTEGLRQGQPPAGLAADENFGQMR